MKGLSSDPYDAGGKPIKDSTGQPGEAGAGGGCPFCKAENREKCVDWKKVKFFETWTDGKNTLLSPTQYKKWRNEACKDRQIANLEKELNNLLDKYRRALDANNEMKKELKKWEAITI